jgi:hypothetical protein
LLSEIEKAPGERTDLEPKVGDDHRLTRTQASLMQRSLMKIGIDLGKWKKYHRDNPVKDSVGRRGPLNPVKGRRYSMVDTMTINFSKLEKFSKQINEASDELTKALTTINEKLNSLNLGIEVFDRTPAGTLKINTESDEEEGYYRETYWYLGYGKSNDGKWGLLAQAQESRIAVWDVERENEVVVAEDNYLLLSCPRDLRIAAIERMSSLIEKLEQKSEEFTKSVSKAKELAEEL